MSCSLCRWTEKCQERADVCPGDCDLCSYDPNDDVECLPPEMEGGFENALD